RELRAALPASSCVRLAYWAVSEARARHGAWACYDFGAMTDRMIRVPLASGEVLLEGEALTTEQTARALGAAYPDPGEPPRRSARAVVLYSDGVSMRPWRFIREERRTIGSTGYL